MDPLQCYVDQSVCDKKAMTDGISKLIRESELFSGVVWRGHTNSKEIRSNVPWFSTSSNKSVGEGFTGRGCCLFKINVVAAHAIVVNHFIGEDHQHSSEEEVIVEGSGKFYKNPKLTELGFIETSPGNFETWYATKLPVQKAEVKAEVKPTYTVPQVLDLISKDEYELLDSTDDIRILLEKPDIPEEILIEVLSKIKTGGRRRRKTRKQRRQRKRKTNGRNVF